MSPESDVTNASAERLQTSSASDEFGKNVALLTASSAPVGAGGRNEWRQSQLLASHTRTEPSEEAEARRLPSADQSTPLT